MSDGTVAAAAAGTETTGGAPAAGSGTDAGGAASGAAGGAADAAAAAAKTEGGAAGGTPAAMPAATTTSSDWRAGITDPELKEMASRFTTPADAVKAAADLRKANSAMTRVPGANATPEEIAKFNKIIGVPEAATEYKFDIGREATDEDKAIQGKLAEIFLTNRVPAAAAPAISKAVAELAEGIKAEQNRVAVAARESSTAELRKEMGAEYDSHVELAGRAVRQWGNAGFTDLLNKSIDGVKLGDHPDFVRVFGSIGRRMGEGGFIGAVGGSERQSLQSELNTIMRENPPGTPRYASKEVQDRVKAIHESLHGTGGGVGIGGRSA